MFSKNLSQFQRRSLFSASILVTALVALRIHLRSGQ
jgi:hypothetical protein